MLSLFSPNYLSRKPVEKAVADFAKQLGPGTTVVDLGCGNKPYARFFSGTYLGVDPFPGTKADIIADAWSTGLPDASADAVILNQSLEHIPETEKTVREVWRILKPGGRCLVTVPQTMRNHSAPRPSSEAPYKNFDSQQVPYWNDDYWRFTKFGLIHLFRDFRIVDIAANQSYLSTIAQLMNYFFASFGLGSLLAPFYLLNNLLALLLHAVSSVIAQANPRYRALIHNGLTIDHTLIVKKP